jgi:hypothetical protein
LHTSFDKGGSTEKESLRGDNNSKIKDTGPSTTKTLPSSPSILLEKRLLEMKMIRIIAVEIGMIQGTKRATNKEGEIIKDKIIMTGSKGE